jgi:carbamoyltransferase
VIAAVEEERYSRKKFDNSFPEKAIDYCLEQAAIGIDDLSGVAFFGTRVLKLKKGFIFFLGISPEV